MKLIIAGGRDYRLTTIDFKMLDGLHAVYGVQVVVSGCCRGCDKDGEAWAAARGIPVEPFEADWKKHGKQAGPMRNREMAEYADAVALFSGGKGTQNMHDEAVNAKLTIFDYREIPGTQKVL